MGVDGTTHWYSPTGTNPGAIAVGQDETVYVSGSDGCCAAVYVLTADGVVTSKHKFAGSLLVGTDGTLYAGSDHVVYAIETRGWTTRWSFGTRGVPFALAEVKDGSILVGSYDSNIYALNPQSGKLRWRFSTGHGKWGENTVHSLAVSGDVIYAGVDDSVEAIDTH
jgi:outer membrane protein assembly factor BamB